MSRKALQAVLIATNATDLFLLPAHLQRSSSKFGWSRHFGHLLRLPEIFGCWVVQRLSQQYLYQLFPPLGPLLLVQGALPLVYQSSLTHRTYRGPITLKASIGTHGGKSWPGHVALDSRCICDPQQRSQCGRSAGQNDCKRHALDTVHTSSATRKTEPRFPHQFHPRLCIFLTSMLFRSQTWKMDRSQRYLMKTCMAILLSFKAQSRRPRARVLGRKA